MHHLKKGFWMVAAAAVSMLVLVGCGNGSSSSSGSGDKGSNVTLTVGFWKGDSATESQARKDEFKAFTKKTGIKIREKVYNDYNTQLMTDLVGGTAPDIFYVDSSTFPSLQQKGVLESLDSYMKKDKFTSSDFYKPTYDAFKGTDGKQYGVPKDYSTLGLYYNEALLTKAGYKASDIPKTDTEFYKFLAQLKDKLPGVTPFVFSPLLARQMYIMQSTGAKIVDSKGNTNLDDPKIISALEPMVDADKKGLMKTFKEIGYGAPQDAFGSGKVVFSDEGSWQVSGLQENFKSLKWGTTELPSTNGKQANMVFTVSWSMNAQSKHKNESWQLINFLTSKSEMATYAKKASVLPTRKSVASELNLNDNKQMAPFVKAANYATPWIAGTNLALIQTRYENIFPSILQGKVSLKTGLTEATQSANKDIKQQGN
ncbi:MAG: ABC transporter substrate-binding protein [Schleiferilactobacillus perolens]|uniref:ABC transporter substrate-binding protein n=1 Tax=Schleiferilactobacillus perolens TaxID=100468 RepID=UPI0039ECA1B3